MEHLTKQQIILLALLVSFVTAIATGITTVSVLDDSGASVPQTIYKVVENTIERVVTPESPANSTPVKVPVSETKTLSITDIADASGKGMLRIYKKSPGQEKAQFLGLGVVVGSKGAVVVKMAASTTPLEDPDMFALTSSGVNYTIKLLKGGLPADLALYTLVYGAQDKKLSGLNVTGFSNTKIGSPVIAFGGKEANNVVSTGIVSEFDSIAADSKDNDLAKSDIKPSSDLSGWLIFDTQGGLAGIIYAIATDNANATYIDTSKVLKGFESLI